MRLSAKRWELNLCLLMLLCLFAASSEASPAPAANIELLTLRSKIFANTRTIRVLLPPDYYRISQRETKYPVFYFTDGIATFHGRRLDDISRKLILSRTIPPTIFVGIDNGGT